MQLYFSSEKNLDFGCKDGRLIRGRILIQDIIELKGRKISS